MDSDSFLRAIDAAGTIGLLVVILVSGYFGWWVWGRQLLAMERDRDEWKALALELAGLKGHKLNASKSAAIEIARIRQGTGTDDERQRIVETVIEVLRRGGDDE